MFGLDLTPAVLCLLGSFIWAPIIYLAAARIASRANAEMVWFAALGLVALPALIAPALSLGGVSLRPPPVIELSNAAAATPAATPQIASESIAQPAPASTKAAANPRLSPATLISAAALLYVYGVFLALGVWAIRTGLFAAEVRRAHPLDHPGLACAAADWKRRLGVRQGVDLRRSDAISSVCVYGSRRPVILIPADLGARVSFDDLVLMVAHELAHIRRGDAGLFAAAEASRALFWFNPFAKRIADMAELAAEQNADALVLAAGADRRRYAACFVEGLKFAAEKSLALRVAVPAFTPFDKKGRRDRLDAILSGRRRKSVPSRATLAAAALLAGACAFAQAALAVAPEPKIVKRSTTADDIHVSAFAGETVRSPADGVVIEATDVYKGKPKLGKVVVINHGRGRVSRFGKLESYSVRKGDRVARGQTIGVAGDGIDVSYSIADEDPLKPAKPAKPAALLPAPRPAPVPVPAAPFPPDDLDTELDGALELWDAPSPPEPAEPAEPPLPPEAAEPAEPAEPAVHGFMQFNDGKPFTFHFGKNDKGMLSKDGKLVFRDKDGYAYAFGEPMSDEDKKRLERSMKTMREHLAEARTQHAESMARMREQFRNFRFDTNNLADIRGKATADARALAERWKDEGWPRSWGFDCDKECGEAAEQAAEDAMREREEALEEAAREREEALEEAQAEREQARIEAEAERDAARIEAEAERESALAEAAAEREAARAEREQALAEAEAGREAARAEREQALAEAEAEHEAARAEAEAEREAARAEREQIRAEADAARAEADASRVDIEAEIRERAEALAEAERDLAEERAELERLKHELDEGRNALSEE